MEETLTYSYIEMLGTLSKSKEGIEWVQTNAAPSLMDI
jgi:hypothetical protein